MTRNGTSTLTLVKGGTPANLDQKIALFRSSTPKRKLNLIETDPDGKALVGALSPQELFSLIGEVGEESSLELLRYASLEQCRFILDLELWDGWTYLRERGVKWLEFLVESGEQTMMRQMEGLDFELLLLIFMEEVQVEGGIGHSILQDEYAGEWDHTFDNLYYLQFRHPEHAKATGAALDAIYRNAHPLYLRLMEAIRNEVASETEELCYQFREARLADLGFPERAEALSIYAYLDPDAFLLQRDKAAAPPDPEEAEHLPYPTGKGTRFEELFRQVASEQLRLELAYLVNCALVAEGVDAAEREGIGDVCARIYGHLSVALDFLAGSDDVLAAGILSGETMRRLFQLGYSLIASVRKKSAPCSSDSYASNKALLGLRRTHPRFYRGLDPDRIDGYREFRSMDDIRTAEAFLASLHHEQP